MISIRLFFHTKVLYSFKIIGHAPDYICSAVSFMAINTINYIKENTNDSFICDYDKKKGFMYFKLKNKSTSCITKIMLSSLVFSFESLLKDYSQYVCINKTNN
jgi:uncharacterized protein YsxB (DUF464 family)